jgi:hypothetical protein
MNSANNSSDTTPTSTIVSATPSIDLEDVRMFVASFTAWVTNSLPVIERGIGKAAADPIELIRAFDQWLPEALEKLGPNPAALSPREYQELIVVFGRAIDAIERVYSASGQPPAIGLSLLDGLEDLLIALALRSRTVQSCSPADEFLCHVR